MTINHYTCPNGHTAEENDNGQPVCYECDIIATHYNAKDFVVYSWSGIEEYRRRCDELQDQIDDAFDNQYFGGGW